MACTCPQALNFQLAGRHRHVDGSSSLMAVARKFNTPPPLPAPVVLPGPLAKSLSDKGDWSGLPPDEDVDSYRARTSSSRLPQAPVASLLVCAAHVVSAITTALPQAESGRARPRRPQPSGSWGEAGLASPCRHSDRTERAERANRCRDRNRRTHLVMDPRAPRTGRRLPSRDRRSRATGTWPYRCSYRGLDVATFSARCSGFCNACGKPFFDLTLEPADRARAEPYWPRKDALRDEFVD